MVSQNRRKTNQSTESVSPKELNSWRRGFTPQAEIWNGRMAIVGLVLFLSTLFLYKSVFTR